VAETGGVRQTGPVPDRSAPIVVMGVSGVGKTTVGRALADRLGRPFLDADAFHPEANVRKMAAGQPLTEADREPWLGRVAERLLRAHEAGEAPVLACSALGRRSRAALRAACPGLVLVFLHADREVILARLRARPDHFMPPSLLASQLQALEPPTHALEIDADAPVAAIVERIAARVEPGPSSS